MKNKSIHMNRKFGISFTLLMTPRKRTRPNRRRQRNRGGMKVQMKILCMECIAKCNALQRTIKMNVQQMQYQRPRALVPTTQYYQFQQLVGEIQIRGNSTHSLLQLLYENERAFSARCFATAYLMIQCDHLYVFTFRSSGTFRSVSQATLPPLFPQQTKSARKTVFVSVCVSDSLPNCSLAQPSDRRARSTNHSRLQTVGDSASTFRKISKWSSTVPNTSLPLCRKIRL